MSELACSVVTS